MKKKKINLENSITMVGFTNGVELSKCSDEDACMLTETFLNGNTNRSKRKLYKYLDGKIIELSKQMGECEYAIRYFAYMESHLKDELEKLREKNGIYIDEFISLEKELYN